jgi:hypothetical protein
MHVWLDDDDVSLKMAARVRKTCGGPVLRATVRIARDNHHQYHHCHPLLSGRTMMMMMMIAPPVKLGTVSFRAGGRGAGTPSQKYNVTCAAPVGGTPSVH